MHTVCLETLPQHWVSEHNRQLSKELILNGMLLHFGVSHCLELHFSQLCHRSCQNLWTFECRKKLQPDFDLPCYKAWYAPVSFNHITMVPNRLPIQ